MTDLRILGWTPRRGPHPRESFWRGKHVIVTGGSEGIGRAIATQAIARGARVSLISRREDVLRATAIDIGATWSSADVGDADAVSSAVKKLTRSNGPCDVLVSCAGIALPGMFSEVLESEADVQMTTNFHGAVNSIRAVLPQMVERRRGHLVLTSSTAGLLSVIGYSGYGPTKAAIRHLALCLEYELVSTGVRVSTLYPPDTATPGYAAEMLRKPAETAAVSAKIEPVSAEKVAQAVIDGVARNTKHIGIDTLTRVLITWSNIPEHLIRLLTRRTIEDARRLSMRAAGSAPTPALDDVGTRS